VVEAARESLRAPRPRRSWDEASASSTTRRSRLCPPDQLGSGHPAADVYAAISVAASNYATSVRVRLTVVPGLPGINQFTAAITDYDTQRPVAADRVTLSP